MPKTSEERIIDLPYNLGARRSSGSSSSQGSSSSTFLGLGDTPNSFSGSDGYYVTVDQMNGRLIFTPLPSFPESFTDLDDVPSTYVGSEGYFVRVNATGTALEFVAGGGGGGYTQEEIEDFVAAQFVGNTGLIDATYDDGTGAITLTLDVSAADKYLYSTGADTWAEGDITTFARGLLDDVDAATARTTLGLGTIATEAETNYLLASGARTLSGDWDIGNGRKLKLERIDARDADGIAFYDDGGTLILFLEDGGNVGVGHSNPLVPLHVLVQAVSGTRERFMRLEVSDATNAALFLFNQTSANGGLLPAVGGMSDGATRQSLDLAGYITAAMDSGTVPVVRFNANITTDATDPPNGTLSVVAVRPLFEWANNGTQLASIDASGVFNLGTGFGTIPSAVPNPFLTAIRDVNNVIGLIAYNPNAGTAAETRISVYDTTKDAYIAFSMGGDGKTGTLLGLNRNATSYIFTNSATNARAFAIGTIDNQPLVFGTNNAERVRIDNNGNLFHKPSSGNGGYARFIVDPGSVTRNQTIDIDIVLTVPNVRAFTSNVSVNMARNGNTGVYAFAVGTVTWTSTTSPIVRFSDLSHAESGSASFSVSAISNGVRFTFGGGDFLNTLDRNSIVVEQNGYDAHLCSVSVTIT